MSEIKKNGAASEGVSGNTQSAEQLNAAPNLAEQAESSAQRNQAYLKKKQAEMEHAELYRQRLRADKERRQALAAQRKANKEKAAAKAEAERRAREEEELARQKAIQDNTEEAERRNAEKDSYLERVSAKRAENEKAAEDYKNAQEEAEREMAERIKEAKKNAENAKSSPAAKPAASASDNAPDLSDDSDTLTISFDEYNDDNTGGDEDEINVIDSGAQGSENESGNAADSDMILTIDPNEIPGLSDDNNGKKAEPKPQAAPQPKPQAAPQPKPQPQQPPMAPKAPKTKKSKPKARTPMDPMKAYLLGSSTYDLVTKETDFGKAHEEKKQKAKPAVDKSPIPPIKIGSTAGQYKYSSSTEVPSFDTGKKKGKKSVKPIAKGGDGDDESNLVPSLGAVSAVGAAGAITAALAIAGAATDKELSAAQTPSGSASAPAAIRSDSLVGDDNTGLSPDTFEGSENAGSATDHIDGAALSHAIEQDDANRSAYEAGTAASDNNSYADEADRAAEAALLYSMSRRDSDSDAVADMDKRNEEAEALSSSSADEAEAQKRDSDSGAVANMDERNEEAEALSSDGNDENKKKDDELSAEAIKKFENDKDSENDSEELSDKDESETDEDRIKKFEEARDKDDDAASTAEKEDEKDSESDVNKLEKDSDKKEADDAAAKKADDEEGARQLAEYERFRDKEKEIRDTASEVKKSEDEALNDAKEYSKKNAKDSDNAALRAFDERNFTRSDYSEILAEEKARREKVCVEDSDIAVAALALDRDEFDRYAAAAESYEDTLFEDEARARDRQHKYGGDMSILMLKECMDIERELLISHTDMLRRAIISENGKYYKIYSEKIEKMLIEYNADIFFWNEYTGEHVARIPDTYLSHVKNGQRLTTVPAVRIPPHIAAKLPYASSRTEEAANKAGASVAPATQGISTQTPLVEADRFPVLEILKETEALNDEATLILSTEGGKSSYSFKDYFRRASAFETELTETEQMLREKQQKQNGVMEMVFLRECIDIERKLLESYVQSYKCAVKSNNGSIAKEYIEKIEDSVKEYNADLAYWSSLTGTKPQIIPSSFTSSLRSKKTVPLFIPVVSLPSSVESRLRRRNAMYKRTHLAHTDTTENNGLFDAILAKSLFSATEEKAKTILVDTTDANLTEQQPSGESIEEFTERYERAIAERIAGKTQAAHDARKPAAETTSVYEPTDDDREIGELYLFGKGHIFEGIDKRASVVARSGGRAAPQTTVASASKAANATKSFIAAGIFADPAELDMGMLRAIYSKDAIRQTNNEIKSAKHNAVLDPEENTTISDYDRAIDRHDRERDYAEASTSEKDAKDLAAYKEAEKRMDKRAENAELSATVSKLRDDAAIAAYNKAREEAEGVAEMAAATAQITVDAELTETIKAIEDKQAEKAALAATAAATAEAATLAAYDKAQDAAAGLAEMTSSISTTQAMLDAELTSTIKALEDKQAEKAALAATAAATAEAATLAAYDKAQDAAAGLAEMAAATVPTQAAVDSDLTRAIKAAEDKQAENAALATAAKEAKVADANSAYDAKMAKKAAKSSANLYGADSDGIALAKIDEKISKANEVTKPVSKRDALVEEVNKLMEATAASALAAKVLEKKLAESSRLEKEVICKIRALRKTMRSAKQNGRAIYLKECLEQEAKLIELYYEDYKLAKSANVKKQIKSYRKKIIHCVREYNIDTTHFTTLTGTHNTRISENFMERIDAEIFALPTLIVPDYLASHTALAEVKEFAEAEAQKAILSDSTTSIAKRLEREALDEEIKKADAEKVERDYERSLTHAERDKAYKTVAAAPASPLDIAAILETTTNKKLKKLELLAIDKRRRDEENIRSFNAAAAKDEKKQRERAEEKEVRRIMAEDYEQRTAIDAYNKKLEALEQTNPELISEDARRELLLAAERLSENESFTALARRELRRYIRDEKKDEKSIIKDIRRTRKKYNNATVRKIALPYLRESIGFVHELLERYVETFKAAVIARHKKYTKIYEKKTSLLLDEYRADLDLWKNVTGESVPAIPLSVIEDVKMGREIAPIPKLDEELVLTPKNERRLKKLDLLNFIKAEKKREKRAKEHEKEMREMTMDDGEHIVISKFHMDTDLDTVKSRIEFRKERYINDLRLMRFRFGEETPKEMRKHRGEITKLAKMKRHGKRYVKYTKRNNERYLKIANLDLKPLYSKSDVHKERLEILQNRIRNLLIQRDEVNMRLLTLYAEENANPEKKRRTNKRRISKVKLKAAKRAFKKQFKLYKLASKYRVPEAEKQRIYEIMNRRIDLRTYLAECKFRKRHEHPRAFKARRVLRQQIKDTKLRLKYADRDFKKFMRKASKRSARTPNPKIQILWCFVLLTMAAIIGGGVYLFMTYKDLIFAYFNSFIAYVQQMISNSGGGV